MVRPESAKLSFVGSIPTRTSILFLLAQFAWAIDPAQVLSKALEAHEELVPRIKDYLGREDIRYYQTQNARERRMVDWRTYDAFIVGKNRVFRLVARNGKPVKPGKGKAKPKPGEEDRISFKPGDFERNHSLRILGEDTVLGRRCWILEALLEPGAPDNVSRNGGASSSDATLWIDQETFWILKQQILLRRRWQGFPEGSVVSYDSLWHDQLPLTGRIHLQRTFSFGNRHLLAETEQIYSNYRRFGAESAIEFNPEQ